MIGVKSKFQVSSLACKRNSFLTGIPARHTRIYHFCAHLFGQHSNRREIRKHQKTQKNQKILVRFLCKRNSDEPSISTKDETKKKTKPKSRGVACTLERLAQHRELSHAPTQRHRHTQHTHKHTRTQREEATNRKRALTYTGQQQ